MASLQQQRLQQEWEKQQKELQQQFQRKQTQLYQSQLYQNQQPMVSGGSLITGPTRSIEAGIGDGFERFFHGMPPIRRRDVSSQQRIPKL